MSVDGTSPTAAIDATIQGAISRNAIVAMSISGGKDSTAAAFTANRMRDAAGHPRSRRILVHADLGRAEWQQTPGTVEAVATALQLPLSVVRHSRHDMVSRWQDRFARGLVRYRNLETLCLIGPWSSAKLRYCTSEMKAAVITRFLKTEFRGQEIVSVIGIRRAESPARRLAPISAVDARLAGQGTRGLLWHPLVDWTADEVFALHSARELPLHDAYTRFGATRLGCGFCVLSCAHNLRASASCATNTDLYRTLVELEAESTFSFQPVRWLADVAPQLLTPALSNAIERAKLFAGERRRTEAGLPAGLRYVKGWPPRLPTLAEAGAIAEARIRILAHHATASNYDTATRVRDRFAELMTVNLQKGGKGAAAG